MAGAAALGLLLASCGGPAGLAPATYAHQSCGAIAAFEQTLGTQAGAYGTAVTAAKGNPTALKAAAGTFLGQQVTGTGTLLAVLSALRAPAGAGGGQVRAALVTAAAAARQTFQTQAAAVAASTPTDRAGFYAVLDRAQRQVQAAGQSLANGLESVGQFGDRRLNDAFAADPVCSGLAGTSGAGP